MSTKKRNKKKKFYALKHGSIDGKKRIEESYDELKKYFDPAVRMPIHKSFDTYIEAYCWLYNKPLPPDDDAPTEPTAPPLF